METASFASLIRTLLWILFIYYAIKVFFKLFGPAILQSAVRKAEKNMYQQFQNQQQQYQSQQQQQTQQNYTASPNQEKPHEKKKVGEYIDFEEID